MSDDPDLKPVNEEEVIEATAYSYMDEVLVEVTRRDRHGSLDVLSYQFAYDDDDEVRPLEPIDPPHEDVVRRALAEEGYRPTEETPTRGA